MATRTNVNEAPEPFEPQEGQQCLFIPKGHPVYREDGIRFKPAGELVVVNAYMRRRVRDDDGVFAPKPE